MQRWTVETERRIYMGAQAIPRRNYGLFKFMCDCLMVCLTCGFWLIWIFVREMRKR